MDLSKICIRVLVKDFPKCFDFYKEILGLEPTWGDRNGPYASFGKGQDVYFSMFLEKNMSMYQGYKHLSGTGSADRIIYCIPSKKIDEDYKSLKAKGVKFIGEPQTIEDWYMRCVYFRDPEGNLFEIYQ